jgi:hypothetical protein
MNLDAVLFLLAGGVIATYATPATGGIDGVFIRLVGAQTAVQKLFAIGAAMVVVGGSIYGSFLALGCAFSWFGHVHCSVSGIVSRVALVSVSFVAGYVAVRLSIYWLQDRA